MTYTTLIDPADLATHLDDPTWVVVDTRFSLADTELGRRAYLDSHIPGAIYAHLDEDLSGPIIPGQTSRHPLPEIDAFARTLSKWGIDATVQVVAYDSLGGAIAARLWWMLRWLGHEAVAVLDGGWSGWEKEGHPLSSTPASPTPRTFEPHPQPALLADVAEVAALSRGGDQLLVDSRGAARYRGEEELIDPVAGHIPGALCLPYADNVAADGRFLPQAELRQRFEDLLGDRSPNQAIFYCGSGVTAAHNLLAMAYAGIGLGRLYAGSWSEWITDPARPVATGEA